MPKAETVNEIPVATNNLIHSLIENNAIIRKFWKRWKSEYIPLLIPNKSKASMNNVRIGDVVLLNEGSKREYWPLAKIVEIRPGRDNLIRSVKIKCRGKLLVRPTKLLHFLESIEQ